MDDQAYEEVHNQETTTAPEEKSILIKIPDSCLATEELRSNLSNAFSSIAQHYVTETLRNSLYFPLQAQLADYAKTVAKEGLSAVLSVSSSAIQNLKDIVSQLHVPDISEERKKILLDSHKLWGSYGWTLIPIADDTLFDKPPANKKEADEIARHACKDTESLISYIRSQKRVNIRDLDEAVCCFRDKRYKSCALVLFGLIDAHLIRFQRKAETEGKNRAPGVGAVKRASQRVKYSDPKKGLFEALFYVNLFTCLFAMFEGTDDFTKKTVVINRNYLDHGMLTRKVTRTDCLQLFLLYYNVLEMLDMTI